MSLENPAGTTGGYQGMSGFFLTSTLRILPLSDSLDPIFILKLLHKHFCLKKQCLFIFLYKEAMSTVRQKLYEVTGHSHAAPTKGRLQFRTHDSRKFSEPHLPCLNFLKVMNNPVSHL